MEQLLEFAGNHIALVAALVIILLLLAQNLMADVGGKWVADPRRATELLNREEAVVVDIRPMADFSKGHIINAINIPMNGFKNQMSQLEKHKDKPIIVACRSGAQSSAACKLLRSSGFEQVYNLKGGILAWQNGNLPVSRKSKK
jgi:rhodanese-related sulfurtransferase